jgi:hypothetical protein
LERRTQLPSRHDPENPATYPFLHVGAREIHVMNGTLHAILGTCSHIFFAELTAGLGACIYFAAYVTSAYACNSRAFNSTLDRMSLHDIFLGLQTFLCHDSYQCSNLGGLLFFSDPTGTQRNGALSHGKSYCLMGNFVPHKPNIHVSGEEDDARKHRVVPNHGWGGLDCLDAFLEFCVELF